MPNLPAICALVPLDLVIVPRILRESRAPRQHLHFSFMWGHARHLLRGLDAERLRDRSKLVADLLDAGGELGRATQVDDLAAHSEPGGHGWIGLDHRTDIGGDA